MSTRFTGTVIAAALMVMGMTMAHAESAYIGGNLGSPDYRSSVNGINGSNSGTGLKLYGGYEVAPNLAVEGGLFSIGKNTDATGTVKTQGLYVDAVGHYEFVPQWSVLGSAGLAQGRFTSTLGNDSSPALKLGTGLQYDLTRQTALRVQYDLYHFTDAYSAKANVGEVSVGVKFGF